MLKRNRRYRKTKFLFLLTIAILAGCFLLFGKIKRAKKGFYVSEILIEGTEQVKPEEVLFLSGLRKERVITNEEKRELIEKLKGNRWIENALLMEGLFGRLTVMIEEREPIAVLKNPEPSLLCSDGKVIPYEVGFDFLPNVYIENKKNLSSYTGRIEKIYEAFGMKHLTIYFRERERTFVKIDGFKIIIGSTIPLLIKKEFFNILGEMKNEGYDVCDMRFKKQIIFEKGGAL